MPVSRIPITGNDGTLTIRNALLTLVFPYTMGDLKIGGFNAGYRATNRMSVQEVTDFFARGVFMGSKYTKGKILEGTFTCHLVGLLGTAGDPTALDPVLTNGDWTAAVSLLAASAGDVPHFTLQWNVERSNFGATTDSLLALKYCELTADIAEGDDGSILTINFRAKPFSTDSLLIS